MPDGGLKYQGEQAGRERPGGDPSGRDRLQRDQAGRFRKGRSGNPAGRPAGSAGRAARAAAALLDGEAEALTRKAVELALGGDAVALRLCLDRIVGPRRGRPVTLALPPIDSAADLAAALAVIAAAAADGTLTPDEALTLAQTLDGFAGALAAREAERRAARLAAFQAEVEARRARQAGASPPPAR